MLDKCQDGSLARLNSTYRVRDKTAVFVHLYTVAKKRKRVHPRIIIYAGRKRQKTPIIESMNTITMPFDDFVCPTCSNDTRTKTCPDCGCVKCLLKTGDPLVSIFFFFLLLSVFFSHSLSHTPDAIDMRSMQQLLAY